ncbi:MAG: hypothetical protein K6F75_12140 [Butyrivibrio sp.]|nr:hypothetical protein [Butyrivibrio sp.]
MGGILSLILGLFGLAVMAVVLTIAAILIGTFFTGIIGGIILLVTGNKLSKNTKRKVLSRVCIGVGVVLLILACGSAGVIINFAMNLR